MGKNFGNKRYSFFFRPPKQTDVSSFLVMGAATIVILAGIKAANVIVAPVLLALFLTIVLLVPLRWLRERGFSNLLALIIVLVCTGMLFFGFGWVVKYSLNDFIRQLPNKKEITRKIEQFNRYFEQYGFTFIKSDNTREEEKEQQPTKNESDSKTENPAEKPASLTETNAVPVSAAKTESAPKKNSPDSVENMTHPADAQTTDKNSKNSLKETAKDTNENPPESQSDEIDADKHHDLSENLKELGVVEERPSLTNLDAENVMRWVSRFVLFLKDLAETGFLVMIITLFMIFEAAWFPEKVDLAFGKKGPINNEHFHHIALEIRRYLFLKTIACIMSASAATGVYLLFGVPGALLWGLIAFFLYYIPNIGGVIAAIIPGLLIFMNYGITGVLLYAVCLVSIECTIGYGIEPRMLGHGLRISTVVIFLSLLAWGWVLGPIGLFLAAPLTIMVKIILQAFEETKWIAILLGDITQQRQAGQNKLDHANKKG
ncbi:MAG: AI-2E family transporter [Planctomycetaceae bacterium]|nr:AI-2E family transporter [Planctomycetaceae bacterium]